MKNVNTDNMSDNQAGNCFIWSQNEEEARRVLELAIAREQGMPEPVLYNDPEVLISNKIDDDQLAQVVEIQTRMEIGMDLIRDRKEALSPLVERYKAAKDAFTVAKEFMFPVPEKGWAPKYWDRFNELKAARDDQYNMMHEKVEEAGISNLWTHWWTLKGEVADIVGDEKALWAVYFQIEDKEEWLALYQVDELVTDTDAHKQAAPDVDSRMLVTDEVYCITHCEEEDKFIN